MPSSLAQLIAAWGIPVGYVVLSIIVSRVNARRSVRVPDDLAPTATAPDIHPVLLGALRCHRERKAANENNAYSAALATIVSLMGRGIVTFEERPSGGEGEGTDDPIVAGDRRRREPLRVSTNERANSFGSGLWVNVRAQELGPYDRDSAGLVMPRGAKSASVSHLCGLIDSGDLYRPLGRFLKQFSTDLCDSGLARRADAFSSIVFSAPASLLSCIWCLLGPALAEMRPDTWLAPVACGLMLAVIVCRAALVDLGLRLTPTGAQILGQAFANVHWAEGVCRGDIDPSRDLPPERAAELLSVLLAMGEIRLASEMASHLARKGYAECPDAAGAASAVRFCAWRTYIDTPSVKQEFSPAGLLINEVSELSRRMS